MTNRHTRPGFEIFMGKGIHITFENGATVSIQIGGGNYCDNYNLEIGSTVIPECANAEIAAWNKDGEWIKPDYEEWDSSVAGYQTPEQVVRFINYVRELP